MNLDQLRTLLRGQSKADKADLKQASEIIDAISDEYILRNVAKDWVRLALMETRLHEYWQKRAEKLEKRLNKLKRPKSKYRWRQDAPDHWEATRAKSWTLCIWGEPEHWIWEVWNTEKNPDCPLKSGEAAVFTDARTKAEATYERIGRT